MSADKYKQLMKDLKQANASDANKPINTDQWFEFSARCWGFGASSSCQAQVPWVP